MNKAFLLKILKYTLGTILSLIILGVVIGGIAFAYFAATAPELSEDKLKAVNSSLVYDNQGNLIADLGTEKRESVTADSIPINLVNAIVSIEDKRFFEHRGIDIYRILGSAWHNLTNDTTQGGSTLDQQLIKLAYFSTASSDQTIKRKAQEAWLALQMERQYTKQEILTFYINKVYMGNGNYGMRTAAKAYFGLDLKDLSVAQLALLAGIPQAPSQYDPYTQPETSQVRRDTVLGQMLNFGYINQDEYNAAVATPVTDGLLPLEQKLTFPKYLDNYLTEVVAEVQEQTGQDIFTAGLKVYTNVDIATQQYLWDVYNTDNYIYYPDADFQVASTIIDVNNGRVIAQLGGRNQDPNVSFGTNQAVLTDRDWGSTMKPISAYAPALETGAYTSTSQRTNDSYYTWPGTTTQLFNWDRQYYGWMTIQQAIMQSRNIPAVRALEAAGLTNAQNFLSGLGINYPEMVYANAISSNTSSADQQYGASSEKMAAAYAAFANGGTYYKPQYVNRIEFSDGTSQTFDNPGTRAMKETTAYMMTDMMKTVLNYGTGTQAAINGVFQAGKTGTSNYTEEELVTIEANTGLNPNYVGTMAPDENFVGYTPQYAMAVWTGYKNRLTPVYGYGLDIAAIVYRTMMLYLTGGYNEDFAMPDGLYRNGGYLYINGTQTYRNNPSSLYENLYNNTQQEITTAETTEATELQSSSELPTANHSLQTDNSSQANNEEGDN